MASDSGAQALGMGHYWHTVKMYLISYSAPIFIWKKKYSMHSCGVNKALNLIYEIYGPYFGDTGHIVKM